MSGRRHITYTYTAAIMASILLTALSIHHYPLFNKDGLLYLQIAQTFLSSGFRAAFHLYNWPSYPIFIAYIHHFTGLSLLQSAYAINYLFSALTVYIFMRLFLALNGNPRYLWVAAAIILVFHPFNAYRADILRGHIYWFFLLWSMWWLIQFSKKNSWVTAIGWFLSLSIATLFRIEAAAFILLTPGYVYFLRHTPWQTRLRMHIKLMTLPILCATGLGVFVLLYQHISGQTFLSTALLSAPHHIFSAFRQISSFFHSHSELLKKYILGMEAASSAHTFILWGILGVYVTTLISTCPVTYLFLAGYGFKHCRTHIAPRAQRVLLIYIITHLILTAIFCSWQAFLSKRYILPLALTISCYAPFGLVHLQHAWKRRPKHFSIHTWLFPLVCLSLLSMLIGSIYPFGTSKVYLYQAGLWLRDHTHKTDVVCTNSSQLAYFTERETHILQDERPNFRNCQYVAWQIGRHNQNTLGVSPEKIYQNGRRDKVIIFKNYAS